MGKSFLSLLVCAGLLLALTQHLHAEPSDSRCDFTDCGGGGNDPFGDRANDFRQAPAGQSHVCQTSDREACKEQCRTTFGDDYHQCISKCLGEACVQEQGPSGSAKSDNDRECVIDNSELCNDECKSHTDMNQPRCRRACLSRLCPNASNSDLIAESSDPGKLECKRCKAEYDRQCQRECAIGSVPIGRATGLINLGCEKVCIIGRCGEKCTSLLPF